MGDCKRFCNLNQDGFQFAAEDGESSEFYQQRSLNVGYGVKVIHTLESYMSQ